MTTDSDTPATTEAPSAAPRATVNRMRWLFRALALLALLLVALLATVWWLATRPDGLQRALALADGMGGVQLVATGVSGPVAGPFQVERLAITHERVTVTVEHLRGELRLGALLYGTVGIQELTATRVVVEPHDSSKPTTDAGFLPAWLRLAWDRLQVDQLEIVGTGAPLVLRQLHTAGSLTRWTLRAEPLAAQWQDWTVRGKAELAAGQPMALQWRGQVNGPVLASGPNWLLAGTFAGDLPANAKTSRWQFTAKSMRPAGLSAQGDLVLGGGGWRVEGSYAAKALDLKPWGLGAPGQLRAALRGSVGSGTGPGSVELQLAGSMGASTLARSGLGDLQVQVDASGTATQWQVRSARVQEANWGSVLLAGSLQTAANATDASGGRTNSPRASFTGDWALPGKGHVALIAEAQWPIPRSTPGQKPDPRNQQESISQHDATQPRWRFRAKGEHLEPARSVFARLGAPASLRVAAFPPFNLNLDLAGTGFTLPTVASSSAWEVRTARVASGGSSLELHGHLGRHGQLAGRLQVKDLSDWLPQQAGHLNATFHADEASLAQGRFGLELAAGQLANPAWPAPVDALSLNLAGQWQEGAVEAQLTALTLEAGGPWQRYGAVRLQQPATLRTAQEAIGWDALCLQASAQAGLGTLCTQGRWAAQAPWEVKAVLEGIDLARWTQNATPSGAKPVGALQAELRGTAKATLTFGTTPEETAAGKPIIAGITHGQLDVDFVQTEIHWQRDNREGRVSLGRAVASARLAPATSMTAMRVELGASAEAKPGLKLQATATLRPSNGEEWQQWPLVGEVGGTLPALDFLPALFEGLDRVAGAVNLQLAIGGRLGRPDYRGQLQLRNGELDVVPVNLQLRQVQATLALAPGELQLDGSARAGAGELRTQGRLTFGGNGPLTGEIRVSGQQLLLADVPEARVVASPDLRFTLRDSGLQIAGTVQIPSARFAPQDLTNVVLPSADERIAGEQRRTASALPTDTRVQLVLGNDVQLDTFGLTGRLQGSINAHAPPVGTTTATGELAVMGGKFKAYTRELEVEKGRLLFAGGPLADPGLDLRASRQFPGVKAGVLVRGTLRRPLVRFFSDPARTQNEIASLLVVGRSLEGAQGTSGGTNTLASATAKDAALQQGGALLAAQLGRYVGLDEVQLERDQNDAASLVLGKYLSPRLYVSYGVGLTAALSALKLRYTLGNRWVIKTEAGSRQSVDLEYTTED
jgi:autotransporter translocation and assembly factor TamB